MADDIMEISSENGLHADEDVDFDFELTAPAGDEDAILEDADSTELGNNFNPQPSPGRGHDDLMIDEDDHHTFTMVDADLIHDDNGHNLEHETMSFASADAPLFDDVNATTSYYENGNEALTDSIDHGQQSSVIDYGLSDSRYESVQEELQVQESEANLESFETTDEDTTKVHLEDTEQPASAVTTPGPPAAEEPQDPPAIEGGNGAATDVPTLTDQPDQDHNSSAEFSDNLSEEQSNAVDTEGPSISTNEVIVFYQSNEYALFSTSELDDPDSFFLSDRSITQKPLSELLNAIRGIIHEDLSDEDELCISFRDLNLETEEVSSILGDVTLAQISGLHEKLLMNDGLELSPLHIELSTRKSFLKRLQSLTSGAKEGKGISEFVSWSENSESVDDSELHSSNNEVEVSKNSQPLSNLFDDEAHEDGAEDELATQSNGQPEIEQEQEEHYDVTEAPDSQRLSSDSKVSIPGSAVDSGDQETTQTETKILPEPEKVLSGEFDEDGDIIDYSEDEFDDTEAKSRGPTVLKTNTTRTDNVAGYAAFNAREDLRRRSSSRLAEGDPEQTTEQNAEPTEPTTADPDNYDLESEGNDGGYDEYNDEYDEQADPIRNDKDFTAADEHNEDENHPESLHHFDGLGFEDENSVEADQELEQQKAADDLTDFSEYLGDETEETGPEQILSSTTDELRGIDTGPDESWDDRSIIKTTGLAETAESSGTVSADEINFDEGQEEVFHDPTTDEGQPSWDITDSVNDNGQADEIDYEDEDEGEQPEEVSIQVNVITTPSQEITLVNGKRPRAETESDDTLENQDAKRPRSR